MARDFSPSDRDEIYDRRDSKRSKNDWKNKRHQQNRRKQRDYHEEENTFKRAAAHGFSDAD